MTWFLVLSSADMDGVTLSYRWLLAALRAEQRATPTPMFLCQNAVSRLIDVCVHA